MFNVIFDGVFEVEYPSEFISDLQQLLNKHDAMFIGKIVKQYLGDYVDFQMIEDNE